MIYAITNDNYIYKQRIVKKLKKTLTILKLDLYF